MEKLDIKDLEERMTRIRKVISSTKREKTTQTKGCSDCDGTGWVMVEGTDPPVYRPCECQKREKYQRILDESGFADEYKTYSMKNFDTWNDQAKQAKAVATDYYKKFDSIMHGKHNSIALLGEVGSGKTHLSIALGNNLMQVKGVGVVHFRYMEMVTKFTQCQFDGEEYYKLMNRFKNAPVLLIDDLYKGGKVTPREYKTMYELVDDRYVHQRPIIMTSELGFKQLQGIDKGTCTRLYEMCKGHIFEFTGNETNYRIR